MKTLIVYYSRTGNTKKIAEILAKKLKADTEEIIDLKNRKGPINFIRSGKEAMSEKPAAIKDPKKDPSKYDLIIIGTPVWASNVSTPIRTYVKNNTFKKVAFFCTTGGRGIDKCFKKLEEICKKPIASLGLTANNLDNTKKINDFVKKLT